MTVGGLFVAALAFVGGEWVSASIMLAVSAAFGSYVWEEVAPGKKHPEQWGRAIRLTAVLALVSVACVSALEGDLVFAAASGLVNLLLVAILLFGRVQVRRAGNST